MQTEALGQRTNHAGGRTPDEIVTIGHGKEVTQGPPVMQRMPLVIFRIEEKVERHFKDFSHLKRVREQIERRAHQGHNRRDTKTGSGTIFREKANDLDTLTVKA